MRSRVSGKLILHITDRKFIIIRIQNMNSKIMHKVNKWKHGSPTGNRKRTSDKKLNLTPDWRAIIVLYYKANVIRTISVWPYYGWSDSASEWNSKVSFLSDDESARLLATLSVTDHVTKVTQDTTEMMSSTNEKKVPITITKMFS